MTKRLLLNRDNIKTLEEAGELCIFKCINRNNFKSYYFSPNISVKLWCPKVSWMDKNSVSFQFVTKENSNLLNILKDINLSLVRLYSGFKESRGHKELKIVPCIFFEKDDKFYVKCNLPYSNSKYHITCENESLFIRPNVGTVYKTVILDIRNIWETVCGTKVGFKLEVKHVNT